MCSITLINKLVTLDKNEKCQIDNIAKIKMQPNQYLNGFQVEVKKDWLRVSTKDEKKVLLEGSLFGTVKCNETIWNLTPGKTKNDLEN